MWRQVRKRGVAEIWAFEIDGIERIKFTQYLRPREEVNVTFNSYDGEFILSVNYSVKNWEELKKRAANDLKTLRIEELTIKQQLKKLKSSHNKKVNAWRNKIKKHIQKENIEFKRSKNRRPNKRERKIK
jgi:hypothetical protein